MVYNIPCFGGIAQLVRAFGSHPRGHRFEPYCLHQNEKTHFGRLTKVRFWNDVFLFLRQTSLHVAYSGVILFSNEEKASLRYKRCIKEKSARHNNEKKRMYFRYYHRNTSRIHIGTVDIGIWHFLNERRDAHGLHSWDTLCVFWYYGYIGRNFGRWYGSEV